MGTLVEAALMALYRLALALVLLVGSPYWIFRMMTSGRYRAGLSGRLGRVPAKLRAAIQGRQVVWVHAVSVGEVLAATRLVRELEDRLNARDAILGSNWIIVVSTTTATGQALARERFSVPPAASGRVFWYPLDFAFAIRPYLRALRPQLLLLMESELWPRMLVECRRMGIPAAVANARVSDRSFRRALRLRGIWRHVLGLVSLFLAQSGQDAERLAAMGAASGTVRATGNLKYDIRAPRESLLAARIRAVAAGRPVVVAGSTHAPGKAGSRSEEEMILQAWKGRPRRELSATLVLAPRHPERFAEMESLAAEFTYIKASDLLAAPAMQPSAPDLILLDTVGDLAAVYGIADVAFIGGSLTGRGGHNPLEPAQFGVPVVMGPSWENFRDIVERMRAAQAIRLVSSANELESALFELLSHPQKAREAGQRGRELYEAQQGATGRAVEGLVNLLLPPVRT